MAVWIATFKSKGLNETLKKIDRYNEKAREAVEVAITAGVGRVAEGAKRRVSVKSGYLRSKISSEFNQKKFTGYARAKAPHAHLVEFGAKGVTVYPKKADYLRIPVTEDTPSDKVTKKEKERGYAIRAKAVIPPRSPHPFMIPSFEAEEEQIIEDIERGIKNVEVT